MSAEPAPAGAGSVEPEATLEHAFLRMLDSGQDALAVGTGSLHLRDLLKARSG
jgi:hypothetical protein